MQRRSFLKFLGAGVAAATLAIHMKFGDLAPVLEPIQEGAETTISFAGPSYMFMAGDAIAVDGEVMVVTAVNVRDGEITVERPQRKRLFGVSV